MSPKRYPSTRIAVAAATIVVAGSLGAGAVALAQSDVSFDPKNYESAYGQGSIDAERGYRANPTDTDAQANRQQDESDSNNPSAQMDRATQDAFSELPIDTASGTTAVNVGQRNPDGTSNGTVAVGGDGGTAGDGSLPGGTIVGPVVPGPGDGGNPGTTDPTKPGGSDEGGYNTLPQDPTPIKRTEDDTYFTFNPVTDKNQSAFASVDPASAIALITPTSSEEYSLYRGQKIDAWTVFCALRTVYSYNGEFYAWTATQDEFPSYKYFRIDSFPDVVPDEPFEITVSYRFTDADTWHTETITYPPAESCVFVLTGANDENGDPVILRKSFDQTVNLLQLTDALMSKLGYEPYGWLTHLLLGWKENGEDVDYFYEVTPGRHVLTPGDFVEAPAGMTIGTDFYYLDDHYQSMVGRGLLCYLQRLSSVYDPTVVKTDDAGKTTFEVPLGVQSVDIDSWGDPLVVDELVLPRTVMYVNFVGTELRVEDSFKVSDDNPYCTIVQDCVLATKDGTRYLGVPAAMETLDVPADVTQVTLQEMNDLNRLTIEGTDPENLPQINFEALSGCNIVVDDDCLEALVEQNHAALEYGGANTLSTTSNPDEQLFTKNGMIYTADTLKRVVNIGMGSITVNGPHTVATGCFAGNTDVSTIMLTGADPYTFQPGSLSGGNVSTIICQTKEQMESVTSQLDAAGGEGVEVIYAHHGANGFTYYTQTENGTPYTTILAAPYDLTVFDGTVLDENGNPLSVNAISTYAFADNTNLKWVVLPESVSFIGVRAFAGCTSLEGVLISNTDTVTLESEAFSNCWSLRYIASRAMYGDFTFDMAPTDQCTLYRPTGSEGTDGYIYNFVQFTPESGVFDYTLIAQDNGNHILYGCDAEGNPWLALRSGTELPDEVKLPETTIEIYIEAFRYATGDYTVNWRDLTNLQYVDGSAFANTALSGEVYLGAKDMWIVSIGSDAFTSCPNITSFVSESDGIDLQAWSFSNCTGLKSASIAGTSEPGYAWSIDSGAFYGCPALESIEFTNPLPPDISIYDSGIPFRFDGDDTCGEDCDRIALKVPEGCEQAYIEKWAYLFLGCFDYDDMYDKVYKQLYNNTGIRPTIVEVKREMASQLLISENYLRKMMGLEPADSSSIIKIEENELGYAFEMEGDTAVLIGVPTDASVIDLNAGIGDAYTSVTIPKNAFATCTNLKTIIVSDKVTSIETEAFTGCDGVEVRMPETLSAQLTGGTRVVQFLFGADIKLVIPQASVNDYLSAWPMQCMGLDEFSLMDFVWGEYVDLLFSLPELYAEDLNEAVNTPLMLHENYIRSFMEGYDPISSIDELTYFVDAGAMAGLEPRPTESSDLSSADVKSAFPASEALPERAAEGEDAGTNANSPATDNAPSSDPADADGESTLPAATESSVPASGEIANADEKEEGEDPIR